MSRGKKGPLWVIVCVALWARVLVTKQKRAKAHAGFWASIDLF